MKRASSARPGLSHLPTEWPNRAAADLDLKSSLEIARIMNSEDAKVATAVKRALPQIARGIDFIVKGLKQGGRLIYVGAGTSGRIAALDAAECPPTFNSNPKTVRFVIAGGVDALASAVESNEDSRRGGAHAIARLKPGKNDVVVGIAASGRTPFTIAAVDYARRHGSKTIAVTCNPNSPLEKSAHVAIVTPVGPEVISGSTRLKAGTAQKMVLNMLSSAAMTRLGYVFGNLMINVRQKNVKLSDRAATILQLSAGMSADGARSALKAAGNSLPTALVMVKRGISRAAANRALKAVQGNVRQAIGLR